MKRKEKMKYVGRFGGKTGRKRRVWTTKASIRG